MLPLIDPSHSARRLPAASRGNLAGTFGGSLEEGGMSPVAIVTASDSGIGQECAKELAENGFDVGITYRSDEAGAKETLSAVEAAGRRGEVRHLDLTGLPRAADVIDDLADALGGVDVLVNNAGTGDPTGDFLELPYEEWRQVLDTNLSGAFLCAQRAARRMVEAGSSTSPPSTSTSPASAHRPTAPPRAASASSPRSWPWSSGSSASP
jgi:NAD(P)-dependent dehydrogenase (short-subunit alcohol dehydrogenase family)